MGSISELLKKPFKKKPNSNNDLKEAIDTVIAQMASDIIKLTESVTDGELELDEYGSCVCDYGSATVTDKGLCVELNSSYYCPDGSTTLGFSVGFYLRSHTSSSQAGVDVAKAVSNISHWSCTYDGRHHVSLTTYFKFLLNDH